MRRLLGRKSSSDCYRPEMLLILSCRIIIPRALPAGGLYSADDCIWKNWRKTDRNRARDKLGCNKSDDAEECRAKTMIGKIHKTVTPQIELTISPTRANRATSTRALFCVPLSTSRPLFSRIGAPVKYAAWACAGREYIHPFASTMAKNCCSKARLARVLLEPKMMSFDLARVMETLILLQSLSRSPT